MLEFSEKGFYPYAFEPLTPVYIGGGEELTPLDYIIREPLPGQIEVALINYPLWLSANLDNEMTRMALNSGEIGDLREALTKDTRISRFIIGRIPISNPELGKQLLEKRSRVESEAELAPFIRNPYTRLPYIPATSLKGAISTALIDYLNELRRNRGAVTLREAPDKERQRIMEEMLGKISDHAMRAAKMGDIPLPPDVTSIRRVIALGYKPKSVEVRTPTETLNPRALTKNPVYGNLRLRVDRGAGVIEFPGNIRVDRKKLCRICNDFYISRFNNELSKYYGADGYPEIAVGLKEAKSRVDRIKREEEVLLRVGRYSHIECVTVSGEPSLKSWGTSRASVDREVPFGWVILRFCDLAEYQEGAAATEKLIRERIKDIDSMEAANSSYMGKADAWAREEVKKQAAAEEKKREREAREKEEAERARQLEEMLNSLPEEERDICRLENDDGISEADANAVYAKLDTLGALQKRAAIALKVFFEKNGKWSGKDLSKRQKEKVKKIREILAQADRE